MVLLGNLQLIKRLNGHRTILKRGKGKFMDGGFGRIGGKLQISPDSLAGSYYFTFYPSIVLRQYQERLLQSNVVVLSLVILRDHYVMPVFMYSRVKSKNPLFILCEKL